MINPRNYLSSTINELISSAITWINQGQKIALLTLVSVEGSTPYPVGTQMLVREDGEYKGQITGGCAETSLVEQALTVIDNGKNVIERYGLNSRFFDIKLPCGSGLDIEFDVQTPLHEYVNIARKLRNRQTVVVSDVKRYLPTPRILLFGQGPIVTSLVQLATASGFDVLLFDHQKQRDFTCYCDQQTCLVSLFHEHELEIDILATAVRQPLFFIGALGSRKTHTIRIEQLSELGVGVNQLKKIHGPIGIDIHSQTPEQIAISIIAQVILEMNK